MSSLFPTAPALYAPNEGKNNLNDVVNSDSVVFKNTHSNIIWDENIVVANKSRMNTIKDIMNEIVITKNLFKDKIKKLHSHLNAIRVAEYTLFSVEPPLAVVGVVFPVVSLFAVPSLLLSSAIHLASNSIRIKLEKKLFRYYSNLSLCIQTLDDLSIKVDRILEDNIVTINELGEIKQIREKFQNNIVI